VGFFTSVLKGKTVQLRKPPITRLGWHKHFAKRYDANPKETTAQMSLWYLILHLAFD